ncbi:hypothetical protein M8846_10275 [Pasteurella multocida]|nr:hypothetical protein [Pasteurella multocida]URH80195.1 hypothetical protein M8846_10275 [Pasteurella multocida]HEA3283276.1 hypothetical protein [Pasteurella multocida]
MAKRKMPQGSPKRHSIYCLDHPRSIFFTAWLSQEVKTTNYIKRPQIKLKINIGKKYYEFN